MAGGMGAASFGGSFAKGLAGILGQTRGQQLEMDARKSQQQMQGNLALLGPALEWGSQNGDFSLAERIMGEINPDFVKQFKKEGSPFAMLGPLLQSQGQLASTQSSGGTDASGGLIAPMSKTESPGVLPSTQQAGMLAPKGASPAAGQPGQASGQTFMGMHVPSPEEKLQQKVETQRQLDAATMQRARDVLTEMRKTKPDATIEDAFRVIGIDFPQRPATAAAQGFTLNPGDTRYSPSGQEIAHAPERTTPANAPQMGTVEDYVLRRQREQDHPMTAAEVAAARKDWQILTAAAGSGGNSADALAQMAAQSPAVLQGLNPTVTGNVLAAIASNPQLRQQYEATRMEPIRAQAQTVLDALGQLVQVDPATGQVTGLKSGAMNLYGKSRMAGQAASYLPGTESGQAKAALDQVTGQLILSTLGQMKAQSRTGATGFGQLNLRELGVIEAATTMLKGNISEQQALTELTKLYDRFSKVLQPSTIEQQTPAAPAGNSTSAAPAGAGRTGGVITLDTPVFIGPDGKPRIGAPAPAAP